MMPREFLILLFFFLFFCFISSALCSVHKSSLRRNSSWETSFFCCWFCGFFTLSNNRTRTYIDLSIRGERESPQMPTQCMQRIVIGSKIPSQKKCPLLVTAAEENKKKEKSNRNVIKNVRNVAKFPRDASIDGEIPWITFGSENSHGKLGQGDVYEKLLIGHASEAGESFSSSLHAEEL